jgi:hypothetical protein
VLDSVSAQSGGKIPAALPILLTEFGYESNPPDPRNGIPLLRQAQFNQLAEFLAYLDPRVTATTQFLLKDAPPLKQYPVGSRLYWFTYQSGLLDIRNRAKPAAFAYTFPFVILNPGVPGMTGFWGQLRFRPNGSDDVAVIFWRPTDNKKPCGPDGWLQMGAPVKTSFRGYFTGTFATPGPGGQYCALYFDPKKGKITNRSLTTTP